MIKFILGIRTICTQQEYSLSSLMNCIRLLSVYILKHPQGANKFNLGNRQEFAQLWDAHYKISIKQFTFTSNNGIQFAKNYQKNDQGDVDGNSDALIIPVPPNTEGYQRPVYDFKVYFSKRPLNSSCDSLYLCINKEAKDLAQDSWFYNIQLGENICRLLIKDICTTVGININGRDIVNHSGRSIPITFLFQKGVPTATTMSLTGHRNQQREDALSLLINNVGLVSLNNLEHKESSNYQKQVVNNDNRKQILSKRTTSTASRFSSVFAPFRPPFKDSSKVNLPLHSALSYLKPSHSEPSYSELSHLEPSQRKKPSHQGCDQMPELNNGNTVIKNYYNINAKYVKIIKKRKKY
ncbi:22509_t:CDS:2 [Gigaspora margarita]|uniref:22509_t:CDS:1 n=1 Tax=Gigaspora margarita TaxID=4874 RepID=A0ABN7VEX8_GIGMA|nr:22509_t:CDS:2 [Gigaspora margarita]